jgi:DNA-binding NarL/FixJ family response regulator
VPDIKRPDLVDDEVIDIGRAASAAPHQQPAASLDSLGLSKRQQDVLAYLLKGLPNKMIAREMGLSVETIKDHVAAVLKALKVSSRTQAVLAVSQMTQTAAGGWKSSK